MDTLTTSSLPGMQTFTTSSLPGVESMSSESEGEEFVPTISPITAFYKDKSVFITGGTGFMGKVLVEKLLRSTPVARIFLLIRPKKGVSAKERLQQLLSAPIFDRVKESGEVESRVVAVSSFLLPHPPHPGSSSPRCPWCSTAPPPSGLMKN